MKDFKVSVVVTRENAGQLDEFKALADSYGAQLRITRLRPSGRGADVWDELHPTQQQQRELYDWLLANGEDVLTGDSFFHLSALRRGPARAQPLRRRPGGLPDRPGRRRLRLPVRHPRELPRRQRPRRGRLPAGLAASGAVRRAAQPADRRRLHEVRALRRLPRRLHGGQVLHRPAARRPDPECVQGYGETALAARSPPPPPPPPPQDDVEVLRAVREPGLDDGVPELALLLQVVDDDGVPGQRDPLELPDVVTLT